MEQTIEGRKDALREFAIKFVKFLEKDPSIGFLNPNHRLFVVQEARSPALSCEACKNHLGTCFLDISDSLAAFHKKGENEKKCTKLDCLIRIVHAVINFQSSLDEKWYLDAIKDIESSSLASRTLSSEDSQMALAPCYAAFAEIVSLCTISHGLNVAFQMLGMEEPSLPTSMAATASTSLDFSSMLKNPLRFKNFYDGVVPYFLWKDVDPNSDVMKNFNNETLAQLPEYLSSDLPTCGLYMALQDSIMFHDFVEVGYLSSRKVRFMLKRQNCHFVIFTIVLISICSSSIYFILINLGCNQTMGIIRFHVSLP